MEVHIQYALDEERQPVAVQVPIKELERIEEVPENIGWARLMTVRAAGILRVRIRRELCLHKARDYKA